MVVVDEVVKALAVQNRVEVLLRVPEGARDAIGVRAEDVRAAVVDELGALVSDAQQKLA